MGVLNKIVLVLVLFVCSACTSSTHVWLTNDRPSHETNYKKIQIFIQNPGRRSRPLGLITIARDGENATWGMEILKMEAAEMGADAVANVEMNYTTGIFPSLRIQGLAVKYE